MSTPLHLKTLLGDHPTTLALKRGEIKTASVVLDIADWSYYWYGVERVKLARGTMVSRGRPVDPAKIQQTALLAIEGELDDISGIGQTRAAIDLCRLPGTPPGKTYAASAVVHSDCFERTVTARHAHERKCQSSDRKY